MTAASPADGGPAHRIASDYAPPGAGKKKAGGRKVASKAGEKRYGLPIGTPLGGTNSKGKGEAATKRSYETFMAASTATDQRANARWMSTDELGRTAEALFSFESTNERDQSARTVLVKELADRGVDPAQYGYKGIPVVLNPNPKEDPTVKAVRLAQSKATQEATRAEHDAAAAQKKTDQDAAEAKKKADQEAAAAARAKAAQELINGRDRSGLVRRASAVTAAFNPAQPRDRHGRWIDMGAFVHFSEGILGKKQSGQVVGVDKSGKYRVKTRSGEKLVAGNKLEVVNVQAQLPNGVPVGQAVDQQTGQLINNTNRTLGVPDAPAAAPAAPRPATTFPPDLEARLAEVLAINAKHADPVSRAVAISESRAGRPRRTPADHAKEFLADPANTEALKDPKFRAYTEELAQGKTMSEASQTSGYDPANPSGAPAPAPAPAAPPVDTDAPRSPTPEVAHPELSASEAESARKYFVNSYGPINRKLRTGDAADPNGKYTDETIPEHVANLDSAIAKSKSTKAATLYRGAGPGVIGDLQVGSTITDNGYMSTTGDLGVASKGYSKTSGSTLFEIDAPAGTNLLDADQAGSQMGESEFVLPRGSRLQITSVTTDENGVRRVKAALLPPAGESGDERTPAAPAAGPGTGGPGPNDVADRGRAGDSPGEAPQVAPPVPAAPPRKSGGDLAQGDLIALKDGDGKELTLTVDGVASKSDGHTVTATDAASGQQYTVSMGSTDKVRMAPAPAADKLPELDEKAFADHVEGVERSIDAAKAAGLETDKMFSLDGKGEVWAPERAKLHNQIVEEAWAKAQNVPNDGLGLFSGGLGGAGKTTTLGNPKTGIDQSQYLTINPDDIKEVMAAKGMIPEVPGSEVPLSPMEKVALIHEESSHIANLLAQRAYAEKKNVTWDITMASESSVQKRIAEMKKRGYGEMQAVFVDIPVEKSVERAMSRYKNGMERNRNGVGDGGRYVPPSIIRKNVSTSFSSANRMNFEALRDQFDNWQVWDNSVDGREPRLVYSKMSTDLARLTEEARAGLTDNDREAVAA